MKSPALYTPYATDTNQATMNITLFEISILLFMHLSILKKLTITISKSYYSLMTDTVENRVQELRNKKGATQEEFANAVGFRGKYEEHLLEIRFLEKGVEAFAFTFG